MIIYGECVFFFIRSLLVNKMNFNFSCLLHFSFYFRVYFHSYPFFVLFLFVDQLVGWIVVFRCAFIRTEFTNKQWTNKHLSIPSASTTQSANFLITVVDSAVLFDYGCLFCSWLHDSKRQMLMNTYIRRSQSKAKAPINPHNSLFLLLYRTYTHTYHFSFQQCTRIYNLIAVLCVCHPWYIVWHAHMHTTTVFTTVYIFMHGNWWQEFVIFEKWFEIWTQIEIMSSPSIALESPTKKIKQALNI